MSGPRDTSPLESKDRALREVLDRDFDTAAARAGKWLECGPGCSACCVGPFPVTRLDVWRLNKGMERLRAVDPARADAIAERAARAIERLREGFPGDAATGRLDGDEARLDRFFAGHKELACPVLDVESGRCDLYAERPVACRTYGPPTRFDDELAAPCPLCFRGADAETVERCRMRPDAGGLEAQALALAGADPNADWDTLIAYAVAG